MCKLVCQEAHMATNLAIDPGLLEEALAVSGLRTKREAVTIALQEFIARRARARIVDSFRTLEWDDSYDYKDDRLSRDRKADLG
jgi:Arc/MetJ family transcription regulator